MSLLDPSPSEPAGLPEALFDRAAGVLCGLACGDALGAPWEGGDPPDGPLGMIGGRGWAPGEWTDDTRMAICIAEVAASGRLDPDAVAERFLEWFHEDAAGIGRQTHAVLSGAEGPDDLPRRSAAFYERHPDEAAGNGSLMRTAPVALAHLGDDEAIASVAADVSHLTHGDPRCAEACVLWSIAVDRAVREARLDGIREGLDLLEPGRRDFWAERLNEAETEPASVFRPNGYVVTALQAAWAAVAQTPLPAGDPEGVHLRRVIETGVRIGHDTDTVGAIAGSLAGARWGVSAVPVRWSERLHGWPGMGMGDLVRLGVLAANRGGPMIGDWPSGDRIHAGTGSAAVPLADDPGVLLGDAACVEATEADVVVSLCRMGRSQVRGAGHHEVWMWDDPAPEANPNLDLVLRDVADAIVRWRDEGRTVLVHCAAGISRSPAVCAAYLARRRGISGAEAVRRVLETHPFAAPNPAFMRALERL